MNDNKGLKIALTVIAVVLTVLSVLTVIFTDYKGPKITVEQRSITYVNGDDKTSLLDGVSAYDAVDGDVTVSLIVKDITVLNSGDTAKVTYAARDNNNNISEAYRIVTYVDSDENYSEPDDEAMFQEAVEEEVTQGEETSENTEAEPVDNPADEALHETDEPTEEATEETTEEATEEPKAEEEPAAEEKPQDNKPKANANDIKKPDDKTPKITLKQKSVNINVGQTFNPSDYIKSKENASSIAIDGAINVMAPGTYPLTFKVTGPDGKTASETLTVVVK